VRPRAVIAATVRDAWSSWSNTASSVRTAGAAHDPHDDLRHDAERPLRAHEEADHVVALRVAHLAAEPDHLAVGRTTSARGRGSS
jgi:hypothetical protein